MRLVKFSLIFILLTVLSFSQTWLTDFEKAVEVAKKERKLILVYIYSEHCPYCHQVEEFVFGDEEVEKVLKRDFIVVSLNISEDEAEKFDPIGTPTFVIYDPFKGKVLAKLFGSLDAETFLSMLIKVCNKSSLRRC
ncbi:thioredoxin family protein [Aquifex pyrophilus]